MYLLNYFARVCIQWHAFLVQLNLSLPAIVTFVCARLVQLNCISSQASSSTLGDQASVHQSSSSHAASVEGSRLQIVFLRQMAD